MTIPTNAPAPAVTVLMACYQAERWLDEALASVRAQTFTDVEVLVVDDGSTDATPAILGRHRALDARLVVLAKPHTGLADSLNAGLARARGAWVARLDADDLWEPTRLAEQLVFLNRHAGVVLLGTACVSIDETGRCLRRHRYPPGHARLVRHLERVQRFFPHSSVLYRAETVRQAGGYNPRNLRSEDTDLWLRLAERGGVACLDRFLTRKREHAWQVSHDRAGRQQAGDSMAARVCHVLRLAGTPDPSTGSEAEWIAFRQWIERRLDADGFTRRRTAWIAARAALRAPNRLAGMARAAACLARAGQPWRLLCERLAGSSLPRRLAAEWRARGVWPSVEADASACPRNPAASP